VPGLDFQLVLGDFNSRVGSAARSGDKRVLGSHGHGERNAPGEELLQFCRRRGLCVANTFFQHRAVHKPTWQNPATARCGNPLQGAACIDYALVKRQWLSSVSDVRVRRGADPAPPPARCTIPQGSGVRGACLVGPPLQQSELSVPIYHRKTEVESCNTRLD